MMRIRVFGEFEFGFCSIKVIALVGLIMMGLDIYLGGNPQHDRICSDTGTLRIDPGY